MNNNVPKSLLLFAKTLLDTDDAEFEPVLSDWTELDFREFCHRHADLIGESYGWSRECERQPKKGRFGRRKRAPAGLEEGYSITLQQGGQAI